MDLTFNYYVALERPFDESKFQALKNSISDTPPCCGGTLTVPIDAFTIFYGTEDTLGYSYSSKSLFAHYTDASIQTDQPFPSFSSPAAASFSSL